MLKLQILLLAGIIGGGQVMEVRDVSTFEMIRVVKPKIEERYGRHVARAIDRYCGRHWRELAVAIIMVESSYVRTATNEVGDRGLGQISRGTAEELGIGDAVLYSVDGNVAVMCQVLKGKYRWEWYHSASPERAAAYRKKVLGVVKQVREGTTICGVR